MQIPIAFTVKLDFSSDGENQKTGKCGRTADPEAALRAGAHAGTVRGEVPIARFRHQPGDLVSNRGPSSVRERFGTFQTGFFAQRVHRQLVSCRPEKAQEVSEALIAQ